MSNASDPAASTEVERDETNLRMLEVLRSDGRISMSALADQVGISRANAYQRVESMERRGIIDGFSVRVDPSRLGLDICALVFLNVEPRLWQPFRDALRQLPEVEYACITTGEHDAMLLLRAPDVRAVHHFSTSVIAVHEAVKAIVSVVVLDELVRRPFVLPSDIPDRSGDDDTLGMTQWIPASESRASLAE
ncbi:Lrp/AsnC family transcriptional regulator [Mycetocola reblochoni]|uniref:Leucine-responsive regulatory protein, regulator for leucine (Or lrp) regulon and high-affinity branched-chain amino acid transport system n=2 Tax=Mycetocola reblochoni TaxID=331618 RepID=A0A1R4JWZ9_9MICO|nr:Lrp/AsnC family transcriptional regulator [Mycetocola reblochoni]RLP70619.1 Lrp/AsnC family transcriptional regulator [Mycetocola reblochoni]SJN36499.1 Leucine-responsive regulatory protein, regulator for leucine (or lrp) regulon and high-affinity branched-chain amino acid transport system [Mycetocola reblochoni REB411]